ncbi:MAG: exopolysaccharide biosynthesis polyprenyl glycosylphosphotransferase [Acidobacteriota bacterium]
MSTVARPALAVRPAAASPWAPWAIFAADVAALELSFALGLAVRFLLGSIFTAYIGVDQYLGVAAAILLLPVINYQLGLYPGYLLSPVERLRRRVLSTLAVFGALIAWDNLVARGVLSRGVLLATLVFALVLPPLAELAARALLIRFQRWGVPVVLLGAGDTGQALARTFRDDPSLGFQPAAFLDNHPHRWNTLVEGVPVAGPLALASDFESRAVAAILCLGDLPKSDAASILHDLNFARVIVIPDLPGVASLWITARQMGGHLGFEIKKNLLLRRNLVLKAFMDRAIAVPLFLLSLPVLAVAALWIKAVSRGPALYRQTREGLHGSRVSVWKLRTMHMDGDRILEQWLETHPHDRENWNRNFKLRHDPRVLPVIGPLLRRTSLDELPQLWSVLRAEMSLVGPRPLPDYHLSHFEPEFRSLRTRVLPGLTGLWQVSTRSNGGDDAIEAMDTYYIRNWSPWLDLYILARTVTAVILARGAY